MLRGARLSQEERRDVMQGLGGRTRLDHPLEAEISRPCPDGADELGSAGLDAAIDGAAGFLCDVRSHLWSVCGVSGR